LHERLQQLDPAAARQYHPHDRVRVVRALEVTLLTGEPWSAHQRRHQHQGPLYPYVGIVISRERRISIGALRTAATLLAAGWLDEVTVLMARGFALHRQQMNSLGYRELLHYCAVGQRGDATIEAINRKHGVLLNVSLRGFGSSRISTGSTCQGWMRVRLWRVS
jgi:tRNA dimethylallyltransferase